MLINEEEGGVGRGWENMQKEKWLRNDKEGGESLGFEKK